MFDTEESYTTSEIEDIAEFIESGGGLFICGDIPGDFNSSSNNELLSPYHIQFNGEYYFENGMYFLGDSVTNNVSEILLSGSDSLSISSPAVAIGALEGCGNFLGLLVGGEGYGNIVVCGDAEAFDNDRLSDNDYSPYQ